MAIGVVRIEAEEWQPKPCLKPPTNAINWDWSDVLIRSELRMAPNLNLA